MEKYQIEDQTLYLVDSERGLNIVEDFSLFTLSSLPLDQGCFLLEHKEEERVFERYIVKDGKREGESICYFPSGMIKSRSFYLQDQLHGPSYGFDEKNRLLSSTWYYRGKKMGKSLFYYPSNLLYAQLFYREDLFDQKQQYYYESGKLKSSIEYDRGVLHGKTELYWSNGQLKRVLLFEKGKIIGKEKFFQMDGKEIL